MPDPELGELAPELALLYDAAREIPTPGPERVALLRDRLDAVDAIAGLAPAAAGLSAKLAALIGAGCFVAGALTGGVLVSQLSSPPPSPAAPPAAPPVATELPPPIADEEAPEPPVTPDAETLAPEQTQVPDPHRRSSPLAQERRLLQAARAALVRGQTGSAEALLARHRRRFARGTLAEERANLEVEVAFARQDWEGVETLGARFSGRYPESLYRGRVEQYMRRARTARTAMAPDD